MEFAIVLTVLIVLVFGMIDVGLMLSDSLALSHLAKDAARSYALPVYSSDTAEQAYIEAGINASAASLGIDSSKLTFTFLGPTDLDADHVGVTLTYPHQTIAGSLVGLPSTVSLHGTGIHRKE